MPFRIRTPQSNDIFPLVYKISFNTKTLTLLDKKLYNLIVYEMLAWKQQKGYTTMTQNTSTKTLDAVRNAFIKLVETLPAESMDLSAAARNSCCYTQFGNTDNGDNLDDVRTLAIQTLRNAVSDILIHLKVNGISLTLRVFQFDNPVTYAVFLGGSMMSAKVFGDGTAQVKIMCGSETKFSDTVTEDSAPMYVNRFARAVLVMGKNLVETKDGIDQREDLLRRLDLV